MEVLLRYVRGGKFFISKVVANLSNDLQSFNKWRGGRVIKSRGRVVSFASHIAFCLLMLMAPASGEALYWDANKSDPGTGGSGVWNLSNSFWSASSDGVSGPYASWDNAGLNTAVFGGVAGTVTVGGSVTAGGLDFETTGYSLTGGTITLAGGTPAISAARNTVATIGSVIAGSSGVTLDGLGTVYFTGANTFTGDIFLQSGIFQAKNSSAFGNASNILRVKGDSTLRVDENSPTRSVIVDNDVDLLLTGNGTGSLQYSGGGNISLTTGVRMTNDANNYTGSTAFKGQNNGTASIYFSSVRNLGEASALGAPTTVENGTIEFSGGSQYSDRIFYTGSGDSSNRNWVFAGSTLRRFTNQGTGTLKITGDILLNRSTNFDSTNNGAGFELLGVISGGESAELGLAPSSGGTIVLGYNNTYAGKTNITNGTVIVSSLANTGSASSLGAGSSVVLTGSTLSYTGSGSSTDRNWDISNGTVLSSGTGGVTLTGNVVLSTSGGKQGLELGGSFTGVNTISGVMSGAGTITTSGSGTWEFSGSSTRTGNVDIKSGVLRLGSASGLGTVNNLTVTGGTLDLNNYDLTSGTLSGGNSTISLGSGTLTTDSSAASTYSGSITGTGGFAKLGQGTLTLTGENTYTGRTTISGGTLALDFSAAAAPQSNILSPSTSVFLDSAGLRIIGGTQAGSQTFASVDIVAGSNLIESTLGTGGSMAVNLGAINYTSGVVNFVMPANGSFHTSNPDGKLGGWAMIDSTDYAKVVNGVIVPFDETDYSLKDNAAIWQTGDIVSDSGGDPNTPFYGTVGSSVTLQGLQYTAAAASTVTIANGQTLGVDGSIMVSSNVGNKALRITGGQVTGGTANVFGVQHNSTGTFTVSSTIVDNGNPVEFVKSGTGKVILGASNTYTGATTVGKGTLSVSTIGNGGVASSIGASSADPENLRIQNATLEYTGNSAQTDRGITLVEVTGQPSNISVTKAAENLTLSGKILGEGDASLSKLGAGRLTILGTENDYSGPTIVKAGTLDVMSIKNGGEVSSIGSSSGDSDKLVLAGGTLNYSGGTASSNRGFTLEANSTFGVSDSASTLTMSGRVVGSGRLTKSGSGTLVLSGTNSFTGGSEVAAGILRAGAVNALGTGALKVDAGATADLANYNNTVQNLNGAGEVKLGSATLTVQAHGTFTGSISGSGGLRANGNTLTLSGCNSSYTGATLIANGTLSTDCLKNGGEASGIGASSAAANNLRLENGTLIYTGGSVDTDRGLSLTGNNSTISVADINTVLEFKGTIVSNVPTSGNLVKLGDGTLVLSGNNQYGGSTYVRGGTVRAGSTSAFGNSSGGLFMDRANGIADLNGFSNAVGYLSGGSTLEQTGNISLGTATLTISDGRGQTYAGMISGAGGVEKAGVGSQTLTGLNSYTGSTVLTGGVLIVDTIRDGGSNSSIGASGAQAGNLTLNGGELSYIGDGDTTDRLFTLGKSSAISSSGTGALVFNNTASMAFISPDTSGTLTLAGSNQDSNIFGIKISDNGTAQTSLIKDGSGVWNVANAANSYTGSTSIEEGTLQVTKIADGGLASSLGSSSSDASNLIIQDGGILSYVGSGDTTNRRFSLGAGITSIDSSGSGALVFSNDAAVEMLNSGQPHIFVLKGSNTGKNTMAAAVTDSGAGVTSLIKNDSGTWVLTGQNTYSGVTTINDGDLVVGDGGTTGKLGTGAITVTLATSRLSINHSNTVTIEGALAGDGELAQIGTGMTVLTSSDNSIGNTIITAGELDVAGKLETDSFQLSGNSTLSVTGTVEDRTGGTTLVSSAGGNSTINVAKNGMLRAHGDLGDGSNTVNLSGTLDTGTDTRLTLGSNDDKLVLNDGYVVTGEGIDGGSGNHDVLEVNTTVGQTLAGAQFINFDDLQKNGSGTLTLTGTHAYAEGVSVNAGTLQIGTGTTATTLDADIKNSSIVDFALDNNFSYSGDISGTGTVQKTGTGITTLSGTNSYEGDTEVLAGTLLIDGDQTGATGQTVVHDLATIGGSGTIGGDVEIQNGGTIDAGFTGTQTNTLTINGKLALNQNSNIHYNLGDKDAIGGPLNNLIDVKGGLILDGKLTVTQTPGGVFDFGVYRLINYQGTLTDNRLETGNANYAIQTAIANQINLVNSDGLTLSFWDGDAGPHANGTVNGGNGTWRVSGDSNWTDADGNYSAAFANGSAAIFQGTAGTVIVDDGNGQVEVKGIQFAVDGYVVQGDSLALAEASNIIKVGDGSAAGAGYTATINSVISGTGALEKTETGTLVLGGANTYQGGTKISAGVLAIASDNNLGASAGEITLNGGTLRTTSNMTTARATSILATGGTIDTAGDLEISGTVSGAGTLTKTGSGTLTLSGYNDYAGTIINGGAVSVSADDNLGIATGSVIINGGTLQAATAFSSARSAVLNAQGGTFQTDGSLSWSGVVSGAGALTKSGADALILTAENTYMGGTTIDAGRLQIGNGGNTGMINGNVINNGVFAFDRLDDVTFSGAVMGTGSFEKSGGGALTLTATNSYTGNTDVLNGALYIDGNQALATGDTTVKAGAALGGTGTIGGNVYIEANATLTPGDAGDKPGTLTINGNLVLDAASSLDYRFGQHDVVGGAYNDLTIVRGDLTLAGQINVTETVGGDFGAGTYRVISYEGTLTDHTLSTTSPTYVIQTADKGEVNLVRGADGIRNFWDGGSSSAVNNNTVDGGAGIWSLDAANTNWTDTDGIFNGAYDSGQNAFFGGTAGVVTVDETAGDIVVGDMQFSTSNYVVEGDKIELGNAQTNLRVGDGTAQSSGYKTTIKSALTGDSTLVKNDLGTLILEGANTYTGGTIIRNGVLQISSDGNLGAAGTLLTFDSGTLINTGEMTSDRQINLITRGNFNTNADLALSGVIDGAGGLTKNGAGALTLFGDNAYKGATSVSAGSLWVNGDQSAAMGSVQVSTGAILGGSGTIGGNVDIADGGTLQAGAAADQVGTLTIGGNLVLGHDASVNFKLGSANDVGSALNDRIIVKGDITLDGMLNVSVSDGGTFGAGVYRLFDYDGKRYGPGFTLGSMPTGDAFVQTSVDHQVNLVSTNGLVLNYWNGNAQDRQANTVNGGSGVWQSHYGNDNWTDADALVDAPFTDNSFAVFQGKAGTVTVDNSTGQVQVSGIQFMTDGYLVNGDRIELTGNPTIRVGDGTSSGASTTAEIASQLFGDTHLVKDDNGTLILSGDNSYKGGTQIKAGTLAVSKDSNLGAAAGDVSLTGGNLRVLSSFESDRKLNVINSGGISVDEAATLGWNGEISGSGTFDKSGKGTFTVKSNNENFMGTLAVNQGALEVDGALCGIVNVNSGGRLQGTGSVCSVNNFDGGIVGPGNSIGTLTVLGNYVGAGGTVEIETVLGDDNSSTDVLKVLGNTSGNSNVRVVNIGGTGGQTVNGIKIIDIAGASDGDFKLVGDYVFQGDQAVIGGAYAYRLYKNGIDSPTDGDWYLRSALIDPTDPTNPVDPTTPLYAPTTPLYETYAQVLQRFNTLGTYQQRTANRRWTDNMGGVESAGKQDRQNGHAIWARIEASHTKYAAHDSTTGTRHDDTLWRIQSGMDGLFYGGADGTLVGSLIANFGTVSSDVYSDFGSGTISTTGFGIGATATWYGDNGLYIDAQTGINWYMSDLESARTGTELVNNNNGYGFAASLEVGKNIAIDEHWSITPQAQLSYSQVDFSSFGDRYGSKISLNRANNLVGRLGVSANYSDQWADQKGRAIKSTIYAAGNFYYDFVGGTRVSVADVSFANTNAPLWAGVGIGGSLNWADGQYSLYGEVTTQTSVEDFWKSNSLGVKTGFLVHW
ncbi:autotransporter-associated beta strand repeat-containing protein [Brucella gallinifaecis]|uniref:Autotransporter outer membrane beta-barrel domain-containing protein n=1 Tax=Brucella gallinifaecis TaxID=215590 RepID=A0A502BMW1_9HYPH|nr:autotransporter-associated beta strand repeat-containing protein [Brucella gallinifaecis]TPF75474.1 autotransporter outer membrane beta-barrel domain-containing protein [Brucella gallinifaecis]